MEILCKQENETRTETETDTDSSEAPVIVCRNCYNLVTEPSHQIQVNDAFTHTFANPHGHVFEIGCFSQAPGCVTASPASSEFTWFKGYQWKIGICTQCAVHLGWIFTSESHRFFGLIMDKLIFP